MLAVIESTWFIQASAGSRCISYLAEDGMVTVLSALWLADADREFHRRAKALSLRWAVAEKGRPGLPDEVFGRSVESFREAQVRSIAQ